MKKIIYFLFLGLIGLPLHANELPIAAICDMKTFYNPSTGSPIVAVAFDASCTTDADSPEEWDRETGKHIRYEGMSYRWIFPAGVTAGVIAGPVIVEEQKPIVKFVKPGMHYVTLWVKDKDGGDAKTSINILISHVPKTEIPTEPSPAGNFPPTADAGGPYVAGVALPPSGWLWNKTGAYSAVQFAANATDFDEQMFGNAQYLQYGWSFGDGCKYREFNKLLIDMWGAEISYPDGMLIFYDGDGSVNTSVDMDSGRYAYDVKPGNTCRSTGKNPTHVFTEPGTYNVELLVVDKYYPFGEWSNNYTTFLPPGFTKAYTTVFVNRVPEVGIIGRKTAGTLFPRTEIEFVTSALDTDRYYSDSAAAQDQDVRILWDFGDGNTANTAETYDDNGLLYIYKHTYIHTYDEPGTYVVSAVATDGYHTSEVATYTIEISSSPNEAPVADFALPTGTWTMRPALRFQSLSYDSDNHELNLSWDFGDGSTFFAGRREAVAHQYDKPGKYVVTLTVTDGYDTSTVSKTIDITPSTNYYAPQAKFAMPRGSSRRFPVRFVNFSYDYDREGFPLRGADALSRLSMLWDFGDGNTSTEIQPRHTYTEAGNYVVTLVVSDGDYSSVASKSIRINNKSIRGGG